MNKTPGDIIILHKSTYTHDHMPYWSWDMLHYGCNCYFSFWPIFCPFTPLTAWKVKISKKRKKHLKISSFYTREPKIMIICYTVLEIWCATDVIVIFSFWAIFCSFTPLTARKMKISKKMKKNPGDTIILHKWTKNNDYRQHRSWDMVRDGCNYFSFWAIFSPFIPLTVQKTKISKNWKKPPRDIIISHKCTKNYD